MHFSSEELQVFLAFSDPPFLFTLFTKWKLLLVNKLVKVFINI